MLELFLISLPLNVAFFELFFSHPLNPLAFTNICSLKKLYYLTTYLPFDFVNFFFPIVKLALIVPQFYFSIAQGILKYGRFYKIS